MASIYIVTLLRDLGDLGPNIEVELKDPHCHIEITTLGV